MQHQKEYYQIYLQEADPQTKQLSATAAVNFFNGSQLPRQVLGTIWSLVADPRYNGLNPRQFYLCLRLIALVQSQGTRLLGPQVLSYLHQMNLPLARFTKAHAPNPAAANESPTVPIASQQRKHSRQQQPKYPQQQHPQLHQHPQQEYQQQKQQHLKKQSPQNNPQQRIQQPRHSQQQQQQLRYPQQHLQHKKPQHLQRTPPTHMQYQPQHQQRLQQEQLHLQNKHLQNRQQFTTTEKQPPNPRQPQRAATPSAQQSRNTWEPTAAEESMYTPLFTRLDPARRGFLAGKELVPVLRTSELPNKKLKQIWMVAASVSPGSQPTKLPPMSLTLRQFIAALHLVGIVQHNPSAPVVLASLGSTAETPVPRLADEYMPKTQPAAGNVGPDGRSSMGTAAPSSSAGASIASTSQQQRQPNPMSHEHLKSSAIPTYKGVGSPQPTFANSRQVDAFAGLTGLDVLDKVAPPPATTDLPINPAGSGAVTGAGMASGMVSLDTGTVETGKNDGDRVLSGLAESTARQPAGVSLIGGGESTAQEDTVARAMTNQLGSAVGLSSSGVSLVHNNSTSETRTTGNTIKNALDSGTPTSETATTAEATPLQDSVPTAPMSNPKLTLEQVHDRLFDELDRARTGTLAGKKVAQHLARSQLRRQILKRIWLLCAKSSVKAGQPGNFLTRPEFLNAVKLIALAQSCFVSNGVDWDRESLESLMQRCDRFDLPPPLFSTGQKEQRSPGGCPAMQAYEKSYYDTLWVKCTGGGPLTEYIAAKDAVKLFRSSGLPEHLLKTIWITAMSGESQMNAHRFYKALRLVAAARCRLPLTTDTIFEYPLLLPVFTGYPHPTPPPSPPPPPPKPETPPHERPASAGMSAAFLGVGAYGQTYTQQQVNSQHLPRTKQDVDYNVNIFTPTSAPPGASVAPPAPTQNTNAYAGNQTSNPVMQPPTLHGGASAGAALAKTSTLPSPEHFANFPAMGSSQSGPKWSVSNGLPMQSPQPPTQPTIQSPQPIQSTLQPAQPMQQREQEDDSWGEFSSGTKVMSPPVTNTKGLSGLDFEHPKAPEAKGILGNFGGAGTTNAGESNSMSNLFPPRVGVQVPLATQPSAPSSSDTPTNVDDDEDWADFSSGGGIMVPPKTEPPRPVLDAQEEDWGEFSAPPSEGGGQLLSPPKTPTTGNLLSPVIAADIGKPNLGRSMDTSNANAITSLFDAFDGLSAAAQNPVGAEDNQLVSPLTTTNVPTSRLGIRGASDAGMSTQPQTSAGPINDLADEVEDEWAEFSSAPDDIHADAETAAPASAAESTALPSHPENATVGVISLDEIDEDDPFHDDVTLGLADGTAAERLDSRRARMERLEEKRLQDEEKQHVMNNPFGQDEYTTEVAIAHQTTVNSDSPIQHPGDGEDEWAEFGSGDTPTKAAPAPVSEAAAAAATSTSGGESNNKDDPFAGGDDDDDWSGFRSGETPTITPAPAPISAATSTHPSGDGENNKKDDPFAGGDDDDDWSGFRSGETPTITPAPAPVSAATSTHPPGDGENNKKDDPFAGGDDDDDDQEWDDFESGANSLASDSVADATQVSAPASTVTSAPIDRHETSWQPAQVPQLTYPLDCDGSTLLAALLHTGQVAAAEAYAQHKRAQEDLTGLQQKMVAAIEEEDFEAAGHIKKERTALQTQLASDETQQEWRARPRDDCVSAAQMFNTVLQLRTLADSDFLDEEVAMLDGFLEFASCLARQTPDASCMVAYIGQYRETALAYHLTTALATEFRGHCKVWNRVLSAAASELTQAATLTEQARGLSATDKWQKYMHAVTRIHAVASRVVAAKAGCFHLDGTKPPTQVLSDCGTGSTVLGLEKVGDLQLTDTAPNRIWSACVGLEKTSMACSLCLLPVDLQNGQSMQGGWYHVECANFWLHRVEANVAELPKSKVNKTSVRIGRQYRWV